MRRARVGQFFQRSRETGGIEDPAAGSHSAASSEKSVVEETTEGKSGPSGEVAELARAEVGKSEISNMMPAGGEKPDAARPLPENPQMG